MEKAVLIKTFKPSWSKYVQNIHQLGDKISRMDFHKYDFVGMGQQGAIPAAILSARFAQESSQFKLNNSLGDIANLCVLFNEHTKSKIHKSNKLLIYGVIKSKEELDNIHHELNNNFKHSNIRFKIASIYIMGNKIIPDVPAQLVIQKNIDLPYVPYWEL